MRRFTFVSTAIATMGLLGGGAAVGCSGPATSGFGHGGGGSSGSSGDQSGDGGTLSLTGDSSSGGNTSVTTVIYANSDTELYTVDPSSKTVSLVGRFEGMGGGSSDSTVTDL